MHIVRPDLKSPFHERIEIPTETVEQKQERWKRQPIPVRALDAVMSRYLVRSGILRPNLRWGLYYWLRHSFWIFFKLFNRLRVYGKHNIPKNGCIFYLNHPGSFDPLVLIASVKFPISGFIAWGNGWFSDFIEDVYGFISLRGIPNKGRVMVEKMIREIVTRNRYFAIWPNGYPNLKDDVEYGFPGVVRLYTTINDKKDRLPFVPVLLRGSGSYDPNIRPHTNNIEVHFLESYYLPRAWIDPDSSEKRSPQEIIDFMMMKIARKAGQKELKPNRIIENRKKWKVQQQQKENLM